VAKLYEERIGLLWLDIGGPVEIADSGVAAHHIVATSDEHRIVFRHGFDDIPGAAAQSESATLANGVLIVTMMSAQNASVKIEDVAIARKLRIVLADEAGELTVGHETEVVAFGAVRDGQPGIGRRFAKFAFYPVAQREHGGFKLFLVQLEQEIALVLGGIDATADAADIVV
jgi:hypothetical protein